ncbi:MAG: hypothetical protein AAGJ83_05795 [Planctomycetota bacterium]
MLKHTLQTPRDRSPQNPSTADADRLTSHERILLESACVEFIGSVEHYVSEAGREREAGYLGESAVSANKILHTLIDFAEGTFSGKELREAYRLIAASYESTQRVIELATSQAWAPLRKLVGSSVATNDALADAHRRCGQSIAETIEATLDDGLGLLGESSSIVHQLRECLDPLLDELRTKW